MASNLRRLFAERVCPGIFNHQDDNMNFRNGYLGACIVILGIIITIVSSYALSVEISDEEVTKYSYVTDLNGLFDTEQSPTYIEYSPSTNYTGYYTDASIVGTQKYVDGITYEVSGQPNAYRLNVMPLNYDSGTLSSIPSTGSVFLGDIQINGTIQETPSDDIRFNAWRNESCVTVPLQTLLNNLNLDPEQDLITFKSIDDFNEIIWPLADNSHLSPDWVIFTSLSDWGPYAGQQGNALVIGTKSYNDLMGKNLPLAKLSCQINLKTGNVYLYYDNELKQSAGIITLEQARVSFGGSDSGVNTFTLGTTMNYVYETMQDPTYMDIKGGVSVEESS